MVIMNVTQKEVSCIEENTEVLKDDDVAVNDIVNRDTHSEDVNSQLTPSDEVNSDKKIEEKAASTIEEMENTSNSKDLSSVNIETDIITDVATTKLDEELKEEASSVAVEEVALVVAEQEVITTENINEVVNDAVEIEAALVEAPVG